MLLRRDRVPYERKRQNDHRPANENEKDAPPSLALGSSRRQKECKEEKDGSSAGNAPTAEKGHGRGQNDRCQEQRRETELHWLNPVERET